MSHVVITGGAGGIAQGIGRVYARAGWNVTLVDFREEAVAAAAAALREEPGAAQVWHATVDLTSPTEPGEMIDAAWQGNAPIDVVVNAAGIYPSTPLLELTADIWDAIQDVNVRSAVLTTVAFARNAVAAGRIGSVVNITSGAALRARRAAAPYSTSKAALEMFTKASALELGEHNIRVNAVSPGFVGVDSPVNPYLKEYRAQADVNPLGRAGEAEDIGEAVFWIAGEKASWVTGTIIRVDGGSSTGNSNLPRSWPTMSLGSKGEVASEDVNA
jgi:NAD(P)-dependent dehydrogenase (short-subunit alcohol dehydrogenase family)